MNLVGSGAGAYTPSVWEVLRVSEDHLSLVVVFDKFQCKTKKGRTDKR